MATTLRHDPLPPGEAATLLKHAATFIPGQASPVRLHGPLNLVRLIQRSRYSVMLDTPGDFWIEAALFHSFLAAARADLAAQNIGTRGPLVGLHARFQLRDALAVCADWSLLDHFIELRLPPGQSLVALMGQAAAQPYYSLDTHRSDDHRRAEAAGIRLPGKATQVVIDFHHPDNRDAVRFVRGPRPF